jgi:hypothetical protein
MLSMGSNILGAVKTAPWEEWMKSDHNTKKADDSPKFGRLLLVLVGAVGFCGLLTWVMGSLFPDFPNF